MKFRNWLSVIEENQKFRPQSGGGNQDQTTGMGPTSQFGGARAMLPISPGFDNRAFAGVMDGIGSARSKIRARKGAEPGVASQYDKLDDIRRDGMMTANFPLQYPVEWATKYAAISKITSGLISSIKSNFGDALSNPAVWRVDEQMKLIAPSGDSKLMIYAISRLKPESGQRLESVFNYTKALVLASFTTRLAQYSHLLNLESPTFHKQQIIALPWKEREGIEKDARPYRDDEDDHFYKVGIFAVTFKPKTKDGTVDAGLQQDMDDTMTSRGATGQATNQTAQQPAGQEKNK